MFGQPGIDWYAMSGLYAIDSCSAVAAMLRTTLIFQRCGPFAASFSAEYGIFSTAFQPAAVVVAAAFHCGLYRADSPANA
jgi:hypothetical protein